MEDNKNSNIELRSEEVQEIMGEIPPWILRWGITIISLCIVGVFVGSYFFRYPDSLAADVTITTTTPPAYILARASGRLEQVNIKDKQRVKKGQLLAVVQNSGSFADVELLRYWLILWEKGQLSYSVLLSKIEGKEWTLGEIQNSFIGFHESLYKYMEYLKMNYYPQKIFLKQKMDKRQKDLQNHRKKEFIINEQQQNLAEKMYQRDSLLHIKNIGTEEEYEHALQVYLQSKQTAISSETIKKQLEMQNMQEKETFLDLEQQYSETKNQSVLALHTAAEQLKMSIDTWMENYVLRSPISGIVNLMGIWSQTQNVSSGEQVFVVIPDKPEAPIGSALLPVSGAGKVKRGQKVEVRVNNFPDQEFGYLTGFIENVSEIPDKDNHYLVRINFPKGLITNYGRRLPISKQMIGSAEIIVESRRLLERIIFGSSPQNDKLKMEGGKNYSK